ncbi:FAD/NAD(P)-binding domain-containing protein [Decorospora gaudefroyi]|uniref:FAD/NAD(P)-binding domain-containing protein n=1 Tax=Decorospora gaudefroyi TaxID=184978 RepID=A0A6A5KRJ3_9PLEO|nr:FAD/NAD(P)-binding domain-containing protein [Decorospora gaudefroyi]
MATRTVIESNEPAMPAEQRYFLEAAKRKNEEGTKQFEQLHFSGNTRLRGLANDIWADHAALDALPMPIDDGGRVKFLIFGAGMGGIVMAIKLIKKGFSSDQILLVETAGGVGGTWYWNRYPGLHCDVEAYCYLPLLEETGYMPPQKYCSGVEIRKYLERTVEKFGLSNRILFRTQATGLEWDENLKVWKANLKMLRGPRGKDEKSISLNADFVTIASGLFPYPQVPKVPGLAEFEGPMLHTARWDYNMTGGTTDDAFPEMNKLKDKVVGIVGTGATAIQVVPQLAKYAKEVYVFQRTPSYVFTRGQRDTDPAQWREKIASKPGWQRERMENLALSLSGELKQGDSMVDDEWTKLEAYGAIIGSSRFGLITPDKAQEHIATMMALDSKHSERARARVSQIVKDEETAKSLTGWYPTWCKRPTFSDEYLEAFNKANVHLINTDGKGIDKVTPKGVVANGQEYPIDILILSTGYRSPGAGGDPGARTGIEIVGRNGRRLADKWEEQGPSTLHGVLSNGYPNLLMQTVTQSSATANYNHVIDVLSEHMASIVATAHDRSLNTREGVVIEPSAAAEEAWGMKIAQGAAFFSPIAVCTPGYLTLEGEALKTPAPDDHVGMMKKAKGAISYQGLVSFIREIEGWRRNGELEGVEVTVGV